VRLNVRLASNGAQIPWETTSLEGDVFIFSEGQKKLSESELEKQVEADITEWIRIKSSKKLEDWVSYLRNFPNGRFAEIAQLRLARLLAEVEQRAAEARLLEEKRKQEEQQRIDRQRMEREQLRLAEEQRQAEEKRLAEERRQREEQRLKEEQRLALERKQREDQQLREAQRSQDEHARRQAALRLERERAAAERKRQEQEALLAEQRRTEEARLAEQRRQERERIESERLAREQQRQQDERRREEQQALAKRAEPAGLAVAPGARIQLIEIRAGIAVPQLIPPSDNPYSAGRFPLGRVFTVGDSFVVRQTDILTGIEENTRTATVTRVDHDEDRVEYNHGLIIVDLMGNLIKNGPVQFEMPVQTTPAEIQVGKKWTAAFRRTQGGVTTNAYFEMHVAKREIITVPAGRFDCFRVEGEGWNTTNGAQLSNVSWIVPGLNVAVKREQLARNKFGRIGQSDRTELVSLRQQATGLTI
jgi:chemotaxis protein histidine kinase CheA